MIDMIHLYFEFCRKDLFFSIDNNFDYVLWIKTKIHSVKKILINCYLLVER